MLAPGESIDDFREATEQEKTQFEMNPPENIDPDKPAMALYIREWIEAGTVNPEKGNNRISYSSFNRATGLFELNGFKDITMAESLMIMEAGRIRYQDASMFYQKKGVRTNLPPSLKGVGRGAGMFLNCSNICNGDMEVLNLAATGYNRHTLSALSFGDNGAPRLRRIIGALSVYNLTSISGAPNLEEAVFVEPGAKLNISSLSKLSAKTLRNFGLDGYGTSQSIITVHPDVYAKLTGDTTNAAAAALSAAELAEWAEVLERCAARNKIFTKPT